MLRSRTCRRKRRDRDVFRIRRAAPCRRLRRGRRTRLNRHFLLRRSCEDCSRVLNRGLRRRRRCARDVLRLRRRRWSRGWGRGWRFRCRSPRIVHLFFRPFRLLFFDFLYRFLLHRLFSLQSHLFFELGCLLLGPFDLFQPRLLFLLTTFLRSFCSSVHLASMESLEIRLNWRCRF